MPKGVQKIFQSAIDDVFNSDIESIGTRRFEGDEEYVWAKGVASTVQYDVVQLHFDYTTELSLTGGTNNIGRIGVAQAAIVANQFGWYQIRGVGKANSLAGNFADTEQFTSATAGAIDEGIGGTPIMNIYFTEDPSAGGAFNCHMEYPWLAPQIVG